MFELLYMGESHDMWQVASELRAGFNEHDEIMTALGKKMGL